MVRVIAALAFLLFAGCAFGLDVDRFGRKVMAPGTNTLDAGDFNRVHINGKNYTFSGNGAYSDYATAAKACEVAGMTMAGFETTEEWNAVLDYMNTAGLTYWFWTSGTFVSKNDTTLISTWVWSNSGVEFDSTDPRWDAGEPGRFDSQHVSIYVVPRVLWAENDSIQNHAMCEQKDP